MDYLDPVDYFQDGFGAIYDELPLWSAPFGLKILDRVPVTNGQTILDVGAGTGFLTLEMAQRCGQDSQVIAVDPWQAGMVRLQQKMEFWGIRNVVLLQQSAAEIDLPKESVDVIVSNLGVNNFENTRDVLNVLFQVMKPQGRIFLTTNLVGHMEEFYAVFYETLVELSLTPQLKILEQHIGHRGTLESNQQHLSNAGFRIIQTDTDSFRMRFSDGTALLRHHLIRLGFLPSWKSIIPDDQIAVTFQTLEKRLNETAARLGGLSLTIPMACLEAEKPRQ